MSEAFRDDLGMDALDQSQGPHLLRQSRMPASQENLVRRSFLPQSGPGSRHDGGRRAPRGPKNIGCSKLKS